MNKILGVGVGVGVGMFMFKMFGKGKDNWCDDYFVVFIEILSWI